MIKKLLVGLGIGSGIGIIIIAIYAGVFFASAAIIMLIWGAIASAFGGPTIGFWLACLVTLALNILSATLRR